MPGAVFSSVPLKSPSRSGIGYIVFTQVVSDATVKHLGAALPVLVLLLRSRYAFQTAVMAAMQAAVRPEAPRRPQPGTR